MDVYAFWNGEMVTVGGGTIAIEHGDLRKVVGLYEKGILLKGKDGGAFGLVDPSNVVLTIVCYN